MARIPYSAGVPDVVPETEVPDRYQRIEVNPAQFGGLIAAGVQKLGEGASKAGQFYSEVAADQGINTYYDWLHQELHGTGKVDPVTGQVDSGFLGLRGQAALDARPKVEAEIEAKRREILGTLVTADQQHLFDTASRRIGYYALDRIGEWDDQQRYAYSKDVNDALVKNGAKMVASDPDNPAALQQGLEMMRQGRAKNLTLDGLDNDNDAVTQTLSQVHTDFLKTRIDGLLVKDPPRAAELFSKNQSDLAGTPGFGELNARIDSTVAGHYEAMGLQNLDAGYAKFQADRGKLPPPVQDRLDGWFATRMDREQDRVAARQRVSLDRAFSAASSIVDNGQSATAALRGVTGASIDAAFPNDPDRAAAVKEQFSDLRSVSAFQDQIAGMTPRQLTDMAASVPKPDPNDPATYRSRLAMNRALGTAIEHTTRALATDPAAYVVNSHPDVAALGAAADKDPRQFPAYATAVLGVQAQMGVPEAQRSVLPMQAAQSMAAGIMADPEKAPATLKQMEQQYGAYWPVVWRDLSTVKGGLPPSYQAVSVLDDERDGALLARWMGDTRKSQKTADDFLGDKAVSGIKTSVRGDPGVQALTLSLARSGSSASQVAGVLDAIDGLAFAKSFYDRDTNAAQDAIESFTSKYEFMPNGGARVPASRFNDVSANAAATLQSLVTQPSFSTAGAPGMREPGNLDPWNRPVLQNPDGSYSTTSSISIGTDKGETLIPTVVDGKRLSNADAVAHYRATGQNLGTFDTPANADAYATALHNAQASLYDEHGKPKGAQIAVPSIYGQPGQPKPEEYLDLLRAAPSWITAPTADALWLMDPQGRIVRTTKGDPVAVPFAAVPTAGTGAAPSPDLGPMQLQ